VESLCIAKKGGLDAEVSAVSSSRAQLIVFRVNKVLLPSLAILLLISGISPAPLTAQTDSTAGTDKAAPAGSAKARSAGRSKKHNAGEQASQRTRSHKASQNESPGQASDSDIAEAKSSGRVWVNLDSGVYHKSGRWYGKTKNGKFMTETEAKAAGYKASQRK
jgi:hypothetical protein